MKISLLIVVLIVGLASCSHQQFTVIKDVDVFDGDRVLQDVDFVFSAKGIESISSKNRRYKSSIIIDGKGKTILPPMINAHVHVRNEENLKEALSAGVFALFDMFSTDKKANNLRDYNDSLFYARFYSSNVGATPPGGHGTQFGINIPTINKTISPRDFVKDRVKEHADYIKITQEYTMAKLDTNQLNELIGEAHKQNLIAVAHVSDLQSGLNIVFLFAVNSYDFVLSIESDHRSK